MAWSVPSTAVSGSPFTAALYNAQVRDNLLATAPALATTISSFFTASGTNAIGERIPQQANATGSSTTASTTYVNLADAITSSVTANTSTCAAILLYCNMSNSGANNTWMSFAVSGATTVAATDGSAIQRNISAGERLGITVYQTGLTPGSNTFTLRYRVTAGTGTFSARRIAVIPF